MKKICQMFAVAAASFLAISLGASAQAVDSNHKVYEEQCPSLQSVSASDALQFLKSNPPTQQNAICTTWAIYVIDEAQFEPAIPTLLGLMDFRRPMLAQTWSHLPGSVYPAVDALEDIGKPSLLPLLDAIKSSKTSHTDRAHATEAFLEIFRHADKQSHGIALLRREATAATEDAVKANLEEAIQDGIKRCPQGDAGAKCWQSAEDGVDR